MPPKQLLDLSQVDTSKVIASREGIYNWNPHRYEFQMLDGIVHVDYPNGLIAGYRDVRADEFWVRGHIPGRPLCNSTSTVV